MLKAHGASVGVSASKEPSWLYQGPAARVWVRPDITPSSKGENSTAVPTAPNRNKADSEETSAVLGPKEAQKSYLLKK